VLIQLLLMVGQLAVAQPVKLVTLKHVLIMVAQPALVLAKLATTTLPPFKGLKPATMVAQPILVRV